MSGPMTAVPASIKAPSAPQVNLIPPEVASRRARGRARLLIVAVLGLVILGLGGIVFVAEQRVAAAEAELEEVNATTLQLQTTIASYDEVPRVESELDNVTSARLYAGGVEVPWSELYGDLRIATPESVSYDSIGWNLPTLFGGQAPNSAVFGSADIGSISIGGRSNEYIDAAELSRALDTVPWLQATEIVATTIQDESGGYYYAFSGTSRVTMDVLQNRFSDSWWAEWEQIQLERNGAEPEVETEAPVGEDGDPAEGDATASEEGESA